ncbi:hypothetical protein FACS189429_8700 [Bacteroidia bacterium]|nr:hypothetical protein FACS189429_8700 [Bacteroidia bacterium]
MVAFSGCKKEEPAPKNLITLDGTSYDVSTPAGFILLNEGEITFGSVSLQHSSTSKSVLVQLAVFFKTSEGIGGTYDIDETESRYMDSWMSSYSITDFSQGMNMKSYNDLTSGTATITDKGNNNYEITFKIKPKNGSEIEGYYSGNVIINSQNF